MLSVSKNCETEKRLLSSVSPHAHFVNAYNKQVQLFLQPQCIDLPADSSDGPKVCLRVS